MNPAARTTRTTRRATKKARRRCPVTGKIRFRDHEHAIEFLHYATTSRQRAALDNVPTRRREVRAYECYLCNAWHTTSSMTVALTQVAA